MLNHIFHASLSCSMKVQKHYCVIASCRGWLEEQLDEDEEEEDEEDEKEEIEDEHQREEKAEVESKEGGRDHTTKKFKKRK